MAVSQRVAVLDVDLETSRRGLPSVLAEDLKGRSVLARTVERLSAAPSVSRVVLVVHESQAQAARALLDADSADWFVHSFADIEDRARLRRARRWGKEGWSGGVGGSYFVCESGNPHAFRALCERDQLERVLVVPAEASFLDPQLVGEVVESDEARPENRVYLSTTCPGLAADVFHRETFNEMARRGVSLDTLMRRSFVDDTTVWEQKNLFHPFREEVSLFRGRFTVDSRASLHLFQDLLAGPTPDAQEWSRLWAEQPNVIAGPTPEEMVVELFDEAPLRSEVWQGVLDSFRHRDDGLLTLIGGARDALEDGSLEKRVAEARSAGALGIHVQTSGHDLDAAAAERLLASGVDLITVDLGAGDDTQSQQGLDHLLEARGADREPFVVISHELSEENMYDWEPIWDRWYEATDAISVWSPEGPRGEEAPHALGLFTPPQRIACLRLVSQMRVRADGRVPLCARDPEVEIPAGRLPVESVVDVWQGEVFHHARAQHRAGQWQRVGHCADCHSWCRFD